MIISMEKPVSCYECVFGEEGGYDCSLLCGELCKCEGNRPEWCPFDNDGTTITAQGVSVLKEEVVKC